MKLYGKNPVAERLKTNPQSIKKIFLQEGFGDTAYFRKKAKKWSIPVLTIPRSKMLKIARSINTQGVLVEIEDFSYTPFEDILSTALKKRHTIVFLDRVNDPQNLGAMIRSLACLGVFAIVIPTHESVDVTEAVLRVASGGDNYVPVAKVNNLRSAIVQAKQAGFWIAGAVTEGGEDLRESTLPFPLSLVVGSERKGIRDVIKKELDVQLTLPMRQARLSFNVAHATTIFCYEIKKQKNKKR